MSAPHPTSAGTSGDPVSALALSGQVARSLDLIHSMIYFAPEADNAYAALGLKPGRMGYFASRGAPMGPVGPGVITATFYNFSPSLVARFIPAAWEIAGPDSLLEARVAAAEAALRRLLGAVADSPEVEEAADLAERAARAIAGSDRELVGRALFAGHCDLDWPTTTLGRLWHATALLREHRGDGHIVALVDAQLSGLEALVTHVATGRGFSVTAAQKTRGWTAADWQQAQNALQDRGLVDADGTLTSAGLTLRSQIEATTDRLSLAPWRALGEAGTMRLRDLGKQLTRVLYAAGAMPDGVLNRSTTPRTQSEGRP